MSLMVVDSVGNPERSRSLRSTSSSGSVIRCGSAACEVGGMYVGIVRGLGWRGALFVRLARP